MVDPSVAAATFRDLVLLSEPPNPSPVASPRVGPPGWPIINRSTASTQSHGPLARRILGGARVGFRQEVQIFRSAQAELVQRPSPAAGVCWARRRSILGFIGLSWDDFQQAACSHGERDEAHTYTNESRAKCRQRGCQERT